MTLASVHSPSALPSPLLSPEAREDLNRYAEAGGFTLRADTHPWYAAFASVSRLDEARAASTLLAELRGHNVPDLQQAAEQLAELPGLTLPTTVRETATAVSLLLRVRGALEVVRPEAYAAEADALDALLAATATPAWRAERGVSQSWWRRTRLARRARSLAAARGTQRAELHSALAETAATRAEWAALTGPGATPSLPQDDAILDAAGPAAEAALTGLEQLTLLVRTESEAALEDLPFAELVSLLDRLASDEGTLYRLPRLRELHDALVAQGLGDLLTQLTEQQADVTATAAVVAQRTAPDPAAEAALTATPQPEPTAAAELPAEVEAVPAAAPEAEVATEQIADAEAEPAADAETDAEPEVVTEADPVDEADADALTDAAAQAPLADAEAAVEPEAVAEAEPTQPEAEAETEAVVAAELIADADAEPAAEVETHAEPGVLAEADPIEAIEPQAELVVEADTEAEIEPTEEAELIADADAEANLESAEALAEAAVEAPGAEAETEAADAEIDAEPNVVAEADPVEVIEPQAELVVEAELIADAAAEPEAEAETEAEAAVEAPLAGAEAEAVVEAELIADAAAEPEAAAETEAEAAVEAPLAGAEAEAVVAVEPEADPEPAVETEAATKATADAAARPDVVAGKPVTAYSGEQLEALVRWIDGDGVDRTDDELLRAAMKELGFSRLGPRIKEALGAAVAAARG